MCVSLGKINTYLLLYLFVTAFCLISWDFYRLKISFKKVFLVFVSFSVGVKKENNRNPILCCPQNERTQKKVHSFKQIVKTFSCWNLHFVCAYVSILAMRWCDEILDRYVHWYFFVHSFALSFCVPSRRLWEIKCGCGCSHFKARFVEICFDNKQKKKKLRICTQ